MKYFEYPVKFFSAWFQTSAFMDLNYLITSNSQAELNQWIFAETLSWNYLLQDENASV